MSWLDFSNQYSDSERGRQALTYFHNYALSHYPKNYKRSLEQLITEASAKNRFLLEGLGLAINSSEISDSKVEAAMSRLADAGQGRLPADWNSWFSILTSESVKVTFLESVPFVVTESTKDILKGTAQIGDAVLDVGKSLLTVGPILVLAAIIFIGYARTRQIAGR